MASSSSRGNGPPPAAARRRRREWNETPSHGGGVNQEYWQEQRRRQQERPWPNAAAATTGKRARQDSQAATASLITTSSRATTTSRTTTTTATSPVPLARNILAEEDDFDRDFYVQMQDDGHDFVLDDPQNLGRFLYSNAKIQAREKKNVFWEAKQAAKQDDQTAWENNRLQFAVGGGLLGAATKQQAEQEESVTLLVHQVKPPFLRTKWNSTSNSGAVATVKDNTSDFAKMARQGSATLQLVRQNKEKHAFRPKFWELGRHTRMGAITGIKEGQEESVEDETKVATYQSADTPSTAQSDFSRTKTMREQREFLPVYSVRDELLNVIRENSIVIIVGETGSGT
jgi:pre-mRNA-splicing factor ATP-dependent RNA helicase DHX38/PRP16